MASYSVNRDAVQTIINEISHKLRVKNRQALKSGNVGNGGKERSLNTNKNTGRINFTLSKQGLRSQKDLNRVTSSEKKPSEEIREFLMTDSC